MNKIVKTLLNSLMAIVIGVGMHTIIKVVFPNPEALSELMRLVVALAATAFVSEYMKAS